MKLITAMVWPDKLEDVQKAVNQREAYVTCANETLDLQNPVTSTYRGTQYHTFRHGIRIEVVVANDLIVDDVVDAIARAAAAGVSDRIGAGSIFVTTLEQWVPISERHPRAERELETVGGVSRRAS